MAAFQYTIQDPKGARVEGIIKASTMDEAIETLTKEGGTIISVRNADKNALKTKMSVLDKMMLQLYKFRTGVPLKSLVFFTRQLSTMFSAGLTIEKSLSDLEKSEKNTKLKKVLYRMSNDIKKGYSLSEAMEVHPGIFNGLYVSLVRAGEVSGTLHTILADLSDYFENIEDTRRKVISAMTYPIAIIVILVFAVFGMFYKIIPTFSEVYSEMGQELPAITQTLINISHFVNQHVAATLIGIISAIFIIWVLYLGDRGQYLFDSLILKIPVLGPMLKNSIMSKFSRTFSILMSAGIPIMDVLVLTQKVVQNAVIEKSIKEASEMVKEGYSINGAFRKTGVFPPTLLQLMATGEETGDMDSLLSKAAEFYEKLVDTVIDRLSTLIEPFLILLIAGVIGFIIVAIYMPIFHLADGLQ